MRTIVKTQPDKTCPACGADMFYVTTAKGKAMPIDADTAPCAFDGCDHPWPQHREGICKADDGWTCYPHAFELPEDYNAEIMVSHFGTCTDADRFRRGRR